MPARVPIAKVPRMCDVKDDAYTGPMEVWRVDPNLGWIGNIWYIDIYDKI